jgi:4-hydroxybenzoyl-CoA thioesterase
VRPGTRELESAHAMVTTSRSFVIEWGHCDPAGIVYFPRYFEYFDVCTLALFTGLGLAKPHILADYGILGLPLVNAQARFLAPSRFGDEVRVDTTVQTLRRSSFEMLHRLMNGDTLAVECVETRVWAGWDPQHPGRMKARPIPDEVRARLMGPHGSG